MDPHNIARGLSPAQGTVAPPVDPFRELWDLGYRRLVPILPPGAPISANSTMAKRPGSAGKAPGVRGRDGAWYGFNFVTHESDESDIDRWAAMGAGVGIKTGEQPDGTWLVGIDADTINPELAATIEAHTRAAFGQTPTRIGKAPKALFLIRLSGELRYSRVDFDDGHCAPGRFARVEILSEGRRFVAAGVHPETLKPYTWTVPLVPFSDLPIYDPEEVA